jgi:hypothetical protein
MNSIYVAAVCALGFSSTLSAASISIGTHELLPDTSHQWIPVYGSGDIEVVGFQLWIELRSDNGQWPRLTGHKFNEPGMLFDRPNDVGFATDVSDPYFLFEVSTLPLFEPRLIGNDRLLGLLEFDTAGIFPTTQPRVFDILLSFNDGRGPLKASYTGPMGGLPTDVSSGRIVIAPVPEPSSLALAGSALVLLSIGAATRGAKLTHTASLLSAC